MSLHKRASFHSLAEDSGAMYDVYSLGILIPSSVGRKESVMCCLFKTLSRFSFQEYETNILYS